MIRIIRPTSYLQLIESTFKFSLNVSDIIIKFTPLGPIIIPFHFDKEISFASLNPKDTVPSPTPCSPYSNSSKRTNFLGSIIVYIKYKKINFLIQIDLLRNISK